MFVTDHILLSHTPKVKIGGKVVYTPFNERIASHNSIAARTGLINTDGGNDKIWVIKRKN